jgi:acyl carrier protein
MQTSEIVTQRVSDLIRRLFPLARKRELGPQESLFASGILDSLGVLELVAALEEEFGITIGDDDLVPDNFQSVDRLAAFVVARR